MWGGVVCGVVLGVVCCDVVWSGVVYVCVVWCGVVWCGVVWCGVVWCGVCGGGGDGGWVGGVGWWFGHGVDDVSLTISHHKRAPNSGGRTPGESDSRRPRHPGTQRPDGRSRKMASRPP